MNYVEELEKLERECLACKSLTQAGTLDHMWRGREGILARERSRAHKRGDGAAFFEFERSVRARLLRLREEWPTGYERSPLC